MLRTFRRYAFPAALSLLAVGLIALYVGVYVPYTARVQQQRVDFERYLNRAVDSCQNGNGMAAYGLLVRAQSIAPSSADAQFVRDLVPRFRAGDCRLTLSASTDGDDVEIH